MDDLDPACEAKWPVATRPATYQGIVETNPYASLSVGHARYVADAAANAILGNYRRRPAGVGRRRIARRADCSRGGAVP